MEKDILTLNFILILVTSKALAPSSDALCSVRSVLARHLRSRISRSARKPKIKEATVKTSSFRSFVYNFVGSTQKKL